MNFSSMGRDIVRAWTLCVLGATLAGCQTVPDISAWNQATKDVTSAVTQGFQSSAGVNNDIAQRLDKVLLNKPGFQDTVTRYASAAQALRTRADDYETIFGAISDYSASLAALARAADNSSTTVNAVAGSLNTLVDTVGGTPIAGAGFMLGKTLASEIIKIKAASDFADAVQAADDPIGQLSVLLIKDLDDLGKTVGKTKDAAIQEAIELPYQAKLKYRAALERRRTELQAKVEAALAPESKQPGAKSPPSLLDVKEAPELGKVEQYLRDLDVWYLPLKEELDRALTLRTKSEELVVQTRRAVVAWRASHASLASAVREKRFPDSGRLAALAVRIRDLIEDLKKEK